MIDSGTIQKSTICLGDWVMPAPGVKIKKSPIPWPRQVKIVVKTGAIGITKFPNAQIHMVPAEAFVKVEAPAKREFLPDPGLKVGDVVALNPKIGTNKSALFGKKLVVWIISASFNGIAMHFSATDCRGAFYENLDPSFFVRIEADSPVVKAAKKPITVPFGATVKGVFAFAAPAALATKPEVKPAPPLVKRDPYKDHARKVRALGAEFCESRIKNKAEEDLIKTAQVELDRKVINARVLCTSDLAGQGIDPSKK